MKDNTPLYRYLGSHAREHGELEQYRSHPGLVDLFTDQTREKLKLRQQEKASVRKQLKETTVAPTKHRPVKQQER